MNRSSKTPPCSSHSKEYCEPPIAIFETSREIDKETYARIQANLADLQARIQSQEEELMVYRGIVSPQDGAQGLRIQSLAVTPTEAVGRLAGPKRNQVKVNDEVAARLLPGQ